MANIRLIKNRIKSAKNIAQITKAMELVSASKMRKAQAAAAAGNLYAQKIRDMVFALASRTDITNHPLLRAPDSPDAIKLVDDKHREALLAILGPPHHLVLQPVVLPVVGIDRLPACRQRKSQHGNSKHQENRQQDIHQR